MSFDKDIYFGAHPEEKSNLPSTNPSEDAKSLLGSIHIQQSWGAFTDWTNYLLLDVSRSMHTVGPTPGQRDVYMKGRCLISNKHICIRWCSLVRLVNGWGEWDRRMPRGHMSAFKKPCTKTSLSAHVICFLYGCQNTANCFSLITLNWARMLKPAGQIKSALMGELYESKCIQVQIKPLFGSRW